MSGIDFDFSPEQQLLRQTLREFLAREYPRERLRRLDAEEESLAEADFRRLAEMGFMGLPYPKEFGGAEADPVTVGLVVEELGRTCLALANGYMRTYQCCRTILRHGSRQQAEHYVTRAAREGMTCAFALTEPDAGSDAASLKTSARPDGDDYVVDGQKVFITGPDIAGVMLTAVRTDPTAPKREGISLLLVDPRADGIRYRALQKLGVRATHSFEVFFEGVRVPRSALLGEENRGWTYINETLAIERTFICLSSVGAAQQAVDDAVEHARRRHQFGRPIGQFQAIRHKLADMQTLVNAARWLGYHAAWLIGQGRPAVREASMAKLFGAEAFARVTADGMQILGGYGYILETDMNRYFRDARLNPVGGGTSEIQRSIIAREMGL